MSNQHYPPLYVPDPVLAFESRYARAREPGEANPFRGLEQEPFDAASSLRGGPANLRQPNRSSESTVGSVPFDSRLSHSTHCKISPLI